MPDIDVDFRVDIRSRMIDYCRHKYGVDNICQIMTKAYGSGKGNLRLAARYIGERNFEQILKAKYKGLEENSDIDEENYDTDIEEDTQDDDKISFASGDVEHDDYLRIWASRANKLSKEFTIYEKNHPDVKNLTLKQAFEGTTLTDEEEEIITLADNLNNIPMGYGQHAAGVIISKTDVSNVIPLMWNKKTNSLQTQCGMAQAEAKGLLKMDFLGLKNLNIISEIMKSPTVLKDIDNRLQDYEERDKILQDSNIYKKIFCTGFTQGIFQFESDGMKKMLIDFQPEKFADIILLVAAYRPGPIDFIPEIIARKWHQKDPYKYPAPKTKAISSDNEALQKILAPTYGCPIYQEQVMKIFQDLAGYSLGRADLVRRAMSKKKEDYLAAEREIFIYGNEKEIELAIKNGETPPKRVEGCIKKQGMTAEEANQLFDQLMPFAKYGFNKSHATAYAMVAMFTAYLKLYHTADFFRSSLNAEKELKAYMPYIQELSHWDIQLKGPSIMNSQNKFTVEDNGKTIRFGLQKIKGFSEQYINRTTTMQSFIVNNPDVSLNLIEEYTKLGMFDECWDWDAKLGRVKGNRHECLRWLELNGENLRKYIAVSEKRDNIVELLNHNKQNIINSMGEEPFKAFDANVKSGNTAKAKFYLNYCQYISSDKDQSVFIELLKNYRKNYGDLIKTSNDRQAIAKLLNDNYTEDKSHSVEKETPAQILENRQWEVDKLGISFDVEESYKKICNLKTRNTFKTLEISKADNNNLNSVSVPAIIISISGEKKTAKGFIYYDVTLMDKEKNIITRRFNQKPTDILDGIFKLPINECKYFNTKLSEYKPIESTNRKSISINNPQDVALSIAQGNSIETMNMPRNRESRIIKSPEKVENKPTKKIFDKYYKKIFNKYYDIKIGDKVKIDNLENRLKNYHPIIGKTYTVNQVLINKRQDYIDKFGPITIIISDENNKTYYIGAENIEFNENENKNEEENELEI